MRAEREKPYKTQASRSYARQAARHFAVNTVDDINPA